MGGGQLPGPAGQGGVNDNIADGTLVCQASPPPGPVGEDRTKGGGLAPPFIPGPAVRRIRPEPFENLSPEAEAFRDRVLAYMRQFRVPTRVLLGHLWNAVPVVSLGESHNETAAIAQVVSRVVLGYSRPGDLIGFEGDPDEQPAVDAFLESGSGALSARAGDLRPVLQACQERKVDVVFMGAGAAGRTDDAQMFELLTKRAGGDLADKRILLWTGKAHGVRNHPGSFGGALVYRVAKQVGREKLSIVSMFSRHGVMHVNMWPQGELIRIPLAGLPPVLVPTNGPRSPFTEAKFAHYTAAAHKSAAYIGIV